MIPRNTWPHTHHDLVQHYHTLHDAAIKSGKYEPWVYPWGTLSATLVILYLLIDHRRRPWLRRARFLVVAVNLLYSIYAVKNVRAKNMAMALGVGLISVWGSIWILTILVCYDAQRDFMRIERLDGVFGRGNAEKGGGVHDAWEEKDGENTIDSSSEEMDIKSASVNTTETGETPAKGTTSISSDIEGHLGPRDRAREYAWQPYPVSPFIERVDWVFDIFCNFRGAGWNWRPTAIPPPPKPIQLQLIRNTPPSPSQTKSDIPNPSRSALPPHTFKSHPFQPRTYTTRQTLLTSNLKTFLTGYIALDILKTFIVHDPYFWGLVDSLPAPYLPYTTFLTTYPALLRAFRLTVSQFAILYALTTIFSLGPLFFAGLFGPERLGARGEAWMYPDAWGPYTAVLDRGLGGWWSAWWHQTFRFAFEAPSRVLLSSFMGKNANEKTTAAKALQLVMAFGLSGALHATGSYTCHGETNPFQGPLLFFTLQALGCFVEAVVLRPLLSSSPSSSPGNSLPRWLNRTLTFVYVHVWFFFTAGLLCDDFARGGIWLFEPIPVSVLRGPLGLGVAGDSWWCWGDSGIGWYRDPRAWFRSGLAL